MRRWGHGPLENEDAHALLAGVRRVIDRAFQPLRDDTQAISGIAHTDVAAEVAQVITALARNGIDVRPSDHEALITGRRDRLPRTAIAALTAEPARGRPPFQGERLAARWLRELGAPYEQWTRAMQHGDDRAAAWRVIDDPATQIAVARALGVAEHDLVRALAGCLATLLESPVDEPFRTLRPLIDRLARDGALPADDVAWMQKHAMLLERGYTTEVNVAGLHKQAPPPIDPRLIVMRTARELAHGGVARALEASPLVEAYPDLAARLRPFLDPLVEGRLAVH